ncbi:MAG TPA: nitroreductase family protein [Bacilli bacterium]|nr:nitroreductase family protein [Bacilli bacterium]
MEAINLRRSVRKYLNKKLDPQEIESILQAAMQAPSAKNQQPWHFLVVQDPQKIKDYVKKSARNEFLELAPCLVIFLTDKDNLKTAMMYPQDISAAIENAMLRAVSLKIGSCWCGVYPNIERMSSVIECFAIPSRYEPFAVISFGYPSEEEAFKFIDRFDGTRIHYEKI